MLKMFKTTNIKHLIVHSGLVALIGLLLISWIHIKPLGLLFLMAFFLFIYKTKMNVQLVPPEILKNSFDRIKNTREVNPRMFCAIASAFLGSLALLGHFLSGSSIIFISLIIAVIFSTKYNFKILKIRRNSYNLPDKIQDNEIDEFLPEVNQVNMDVLERASDQSSFTLTTDEGEEKSEEVPSELLIPDCIPEIDENSTDEDDLIGVPNEIIDRSKGLPDIEFKKKHFKKDSSISTSSSSDEDNLSKGLKFPDHTTLDNKTQQHIFEGNINPGLNTQTQSLIMSANILPKIVKELASWAASGENVAKQPNQTSISDRMPLSDEEESDFEIVNTEEYQ